MQPKKNNHCIFFNRPVWITVVRTTYGVPLRQRYRGKEGRKETAKYCILQVEHHIFYM